MNAATSLKEYVEILIQELVESRINLRHLGLDEELLLKY